MKGLSFLVFAALIAGCASVTPPIGRVERLSLPMPGELNERELGDTLVSKLERTTIPSIELLIDYETNKTMGMSMVARSGLCDPEGTLPNGVKLFSSPEIQVVGGMMDGDVLPRQNNYPQWHLIDNQVCWVGDTDQCLNQNDWRKSDWIDHTKPFFEQELVYNGRVSDSLRFIYREYSNRMARDAFTQEIQYDLNESPIIGFKGARLEVIEATNRSITYKLLANFPD